MNTPLSTFPAPLLRLILCGGGGLVPAWGPLRDQYGYLWPWNPLARDVTWPRGDTGEGITPRPFTSPEAWSLPLDPATHWPARLALVAAWMVGVGPVVSARARRGSFGGVVLEFWPVNGGHDTSAWWRGDGTNGYRGPHLPTLPQHLQTHPPTVALVLALWDIPEIRARFEAP